MSINIELVPPFAALTASTLLERFSTWCWNNAAGICFHSATTALVRLDTDVGPDLGLARSRCSNSSQRCSMGLRSGLCRPFKYFHTDLKKKHYWMDPALYMGALSCWNRKGTSPNCCHKVGSTESFRMSLYAVALRFPFTGIKGPSPNHEKQPQTIIHHPPNFTVGTMHLSR